MVVILLNVFGIVGINYLRVVDNDPFPVAVQISTMDSDHIQLADGRVITDFGGLSPEDRDRIKDSGGRVGLKFESAAKVSVMLYARRPRTICRIGMPIFIVPLIPIDVPRYDRGLLLIGRIHDK